MRIWLSAGVVLLAAIVVGAGCVALYQHAILADETGTSGWNPPLWLVIVAGAAVFLIGTLQVAQAASARADGKRSTPAAP